MAKILGVGIATLDLINTTAGFPQEDSEVRALSHQRRRGGNATNTLVVLSQLGHECSWLGSLADDANSRYITRELQHFGIDYSHCPVFKNGATPTSYITVNALNGSRTIVHYRDLPEIGFEHFTALDLSRFDWIHFEGRNVVETAKMLAFLPMTATGGSTVACSIEIEKPREQIEILFNKEHTYFFSRHFVQSQGFESADAFLAQINLNDIHHREATLICPWAEQGAYAYHRGVRWHSPAIAPVKLVDTIGAGDTFVAGYIHAKLQGLKLEDALYKANTLASLKCAMEGFAFPVGSIKI